MRTGSGEIAGAIGRGLASGAAGTALMTLAQAIEMKLSGREPSDTPAQAVEKVLDLEPRNEAARERLTQLAHWGYGTGWGAARGLIGALGLRGPAAAAAHLGLVWGAALVMLPSLDLSPPATRWGGKEVAKDLGYHAVYALGASLAYEYLERHDGHRG